MKTDNVKGFKDYSGEEARKLSEVRKTLVETFEKYGFEPAETPLIEYEEFVKGNNSTDEAVSDIFKLQDKGKRKLALRYEFTFQLKRLMQNKKLPYKRYQVGKVFRDEPVSSNRFRQFTQADIDVVGSDIKAEAEILALTKEVLENLGIKIIILVNNRKLLNEILKDLKLEKNAEEILREVDKFGKISGEQIKKNLKKFKAEKFFDVLDKGRKNESYFKIFKSYQEILDLNRYCKMYGVQIGFTPMMVRGLSYYNGNIFEIKSLKSKETITAGGSYEFNGNQCIGISFGLERISNVAKIENNNEKTLVISLDQDKEAIKLAGKLRKKGENVSVYYGKPSKALDYANSYNFTKAIFVGEKEVKSKKFKVKDLKTGKEKSLKL